MDRKLGKVGGTLAVAFGLTGCVTAQFANVRPAPMPAADQKIEHVVEKNYTIGDERSAFVGEPVVRVKDYQVETSAAPPSFVSTVPMQANWWRAGPASFPAGTELRIVGRTEFKGRPHYLAALPHAAYGQVPLLITEDGQFNNLAITNGGLIFETGGAGGVEYMPRAASFTRGSATQTIKSAGFVNFEIVYSGMTRDSLNMLYREYTPADMARPAFTQPLTYDRGSPSLRFRGLSVRVVEATNERIRYVVEADGLSD